MPSGRKSVAVSVVGNLIPAIVGLVSAPLLASALGPTGRGELAAATAVLMLGVTFATIGLPDALVYFSARKSPRHRILAIKITAMLSAGGILCSAGIFLASGFLSGGDDDLARIISYCGLAASPALALGSLRGIASGMQAWNLVTYEKLVSSGIRLIAIILAFLFDTLTLEIAAVIMATTTFIGILAYVRLPKIAAAYQPTERTDPRLRNVFSFGMRVWLGSLTGALLLRVDQTLMLPLAGAQELGIYAVAVSISEMALLFGYAVNMVMRSREALAPSTETLARAARISSFVTFFGCMAIAILSVWAVPLFFGDNFSEVVPVVWILLVGTALANSGSVVGAGLTGRGRPGLRSFSLAVALVTNVAGLVILAPLVGAIGAAIATSVANIVFGSLNIILFKRLYGVRINIFIGIRAEDIKYLVVALTGRGKGAVKTDDVKSKP